MEWFTKDMNHKLGLEVFKNWIFSHDHLSNRKQWHNHQVSARRIGKYCTKSSSNSYHVFQLLYSYFKCILRKMSVEAEGIWIWRHLKKSDPPCGQMPSVKAIHMGFIAPGDLWIMGTINKIERYWGLNY